MTSIQKLHDMAHRLGVKLTHHDHGLAGFYLDSARMVSTRRGMAIWDYKSTLAHELGHATRRDRRNGHLYFDALQELRADQFAADILIDPGQLLYLAPWHGNDLHSLAIDLEVTPRLLRIYLQRHPHLLKEEAA